MMDVNAIVAVIGIILNLTLMNITVVKIYTKVLYLNHKITKIEWKLRRLEKRLRRL